MIPLSALMSEVAPPVLLGLALGSLVLGQLWKCDYQDGNQYTRWEMFGPAVVYFIMGYTLGALLVFAVSAALSILAELPF